MRKTRRFSLEVFQGIRSFNAGGPQFLVSQLINSEYYGFGIVSCVMLNALTLGWLTNHEARHPHEQTPANFLIIEGLFLLIFLVELAAKIFAFRAAFFKGPGWKWNLFEVLLVVYQAADLCSEILLRSSKRGVVGISALRLFRLARMARMVRVVRLVPELKSMVYMIYASVSSFFWSLVLVIAIIYCFAVYFTGVATVMKASDFADEEVDDFWGSLPASMLSLIMAITGGFNWRNLVVCLRADEDYEMHLTVFVLYILFSTLVMLNLVTGVFVESSQRIIQEDRDHELLRLAAKAFMVADEDLNGTVDRSEFLLRLSDGDMDPYLDEVGMDREQAETLFDTFDVDHSGEISLVEFCKGCLRLRGHARSVDLAEMEMRVLADLRQIAKTVDALSSEFGLRQDSDSD